MWIEFIREDTIANDAGSHWSMNIEQRVCDAVDAAWVAAQTTELVSVPSVTMNEQEVCVLFEEMMRSLGLDVLSQIP